MVGGPVVRRVTAAPLELPDEGQWLNSLTASSAVVTTAQIVDALSSIHAPGVSAQ
jgi:hypothetical protein